MARINRRRHGTGTAGTNLLPITTKKGNKIRFRRRMLINYTNRIRRPAAATNSRGIPTLPADPICILEDEVAVGIAMCDPTNGLFIFDALAVSVDTGPDVVALDPSLAVVPAVAVASDAADPVDAAVSVTAVAADSALVPDDCDMVVPVPVVPAAATAESVTPVTAAAVSVAAEAELLILSTPLCVLSSAFVFAFGASDPPDNGNRPV